DDSFENYRGYDVKHRGIRPRFANIIALGNDALEDGLRMGDRVLCDTMKWSRKIPFQRDGLGSSLCFWRISIDDILLIENSGSDEARDENRKEFIRSYKKELNKARKAFPNVRQ